MIGSQDISALTKRELEVVRQAGEGLNNRQIAEKLGLSEHTVKNYIFRIFEKIGVSSRVELLFYLLGQERVPPVDGQSRDRVEQQDDASAWRRAAQDGFPTAQLALGLAHQRGEGAEKNELSAYYWLRRAEHNAEEILSQSRRALEDVRRSLDTNALDEVERSLQSADSHVVHTSGMFAVPPQKRDSVGRKAS
jgi:DNA-binding CsgD family transcriptional regulator